MYPTTLGFTIKPPQQRQISTPVGKCVKDVTYFKNCVTPIIGKQPTFTTQLFSCKIDSNLTTMKSILLIEDTAEILENLTEYLEMEGYRIYPARNGKKGIELALELLPDLIICDALMPEMDGHEVLWTLLGTAKTSKIPFIFSTSMSEIIDKAEALKQGADDYIVKPFELKTLLKMAKDWIESGSRRDVVSSLKYIYNKTGVSKFEQTTYENI